MLAQEATPDRPVTPAPENDPTPPSEQIDPAGFVHSPPLTVNDQHHRDHDDHHRDEGQRLSASAAASGQ